MPSKVIVTPFEFRLAFPAVFEPKVVEGSNSGPKYSITMLMEKETDLSALREIVREAIVEKWGPDKAKWPQGLIMPIHDSDKEGKTWAGFPGMIFARASSKYPPGVFGAMTDKATGLPESAYTPQGQLKPGWDRRVYGGCWCRAQINAYAFDYMGKKGVSFGLTSIQVTRDDEPFGGAGVTAAPPEGFVATDNPADDVANYGAGAAETIDDIPF